MNCIDDPSTPPQCLESGIKTKKNYQVRRGISWITKAESNSNGEATLEILDWEDKLGEEIFFKKINKKKH